MSDKQQIGGRARAAALTPERRSEIASLAAKAGWAKRGGQQAPRKMQVTPDADKAREKAERAMGRVRKAMERYMTAGEAAPFTEVELGAAMGRLSQLLHAKGGQQELPD